MPRLSGPEEAIVNLLKLIRGSPQGNQVDVQQTIAPAEVYAQALAATIEAWRIMSSVELNTAQTYVLPAGWYEFEVHNFSGAQRNFTYQAQYTTIGWKTVWFMTYNAGEYNSISPFLSDGTNARIILSGGDDLYVRAMRMGS